MSVARLFYAATVVASAALYTACTGGSSQTDLPTGSTVLEVKASGETPDTALRRLVAESGDAAMASPHKATGATRFLRLTPASRDALDRSLPTGGDRAQRAAAFFRDYGAAVGASGATLRLVSNATDKLGESHLTYEQLRGPVRVYGAMMKVHFDAGDRLSGLSGSVLPDVNVSPIPLVSSTRAGAEALVAVAAARGRGDALRTAGATLYVYREGLAMGVAGPTHLAWEVVVTDDAGIKDLVYVDAHNGKVFHRANAIQDIFRRAYDGKNLPKVPNNYPQGPYWVEGDRFPTNSAEANNMIVSSLETYNFFFNSFGRDSFDGNGAIMDAIFNRGYSCPNASWNGTFISFCPGLTVDDVTSHEWGHAYTQYTHGLIYEWQSGALNESYSDIWGETVDIINGRGLDSPGGARTAACSTFSPPVGTLTVNSPAAIAGDYFAQSAQFGPPLTPTGVTGSVVAALDAADAAGPSTLDGCTAITNPSAVAGNIAIINRGTCEFSTKVLNAQNAGAIAVIIANNAPTGLPGMGAGVVAAQVTIPSLGVQQATGNAIRAQLTANVPVNATLKAKPGTDATVRWLLGEEATGGINGAIRDMANPTCYSNPGRVTDTAFYVCALGDNGGVHTNSGVPNHGYQLLVDGGTYNGHTVGAIGVSKAAEIYFRAMTVYQVRDSDFADHADALEASCADLLGTTPTALPGDTLNGPITAADCTQVAEAIAAVELRTPPTFCNFPVLLNPEAPELCSAATTSGVATPITSFDFESNPAGTWTVAHSSSSASFTARDWTWTSDLPAPTNPSTSGTGHAFFGPTPDIGICQPENDQRGVLTLTSPPIALPAGTGFARASFDHWFSMEAQLDQTLGILGVDGGNVSISVNGGPFQLIPPSEVGFNQYIAFLLTAAQGNTNPLAGQVAWTSSRRGTSTDGSWGRTIVNLGNFASAGSSVRLRFSVGTDCSAGRVGWYVDNVNLFSCVPKTPTISVGDVAITEGNSGQSNAVFRITLSTPTLMTVAVAFTTVDGTATHGNDFDPISGVAVFPPGVTTVNVPVAIKGDTVLEGPETFSLVLLAAANGTIGDGEGVGTIGEDDVHP